MAEDSAELVKLRNEFYRDNYRRVFTALLFMIIVNILICKMGFGKRKLIKDFACK